MDRFLSRLEEVELIAREAAHDRADEEHQRHTDVRDGGNRLIQHHQDDGEQQGNINLEAKALARIGVELSLDLDIVHVFDVLVTEHQHEQERKGESQHGQRQAEAAVGDVDTGADNHCGDVGRRGDHAQYAAEG